MDTTEIRELFKKHDVPLGKKDVWQVQGQNVIRHAALERLSAALGLTWDAPVAVIATMQDVVILARATRKDGISEWSYGEASIVRDGHVGGNYKVSGKQAAYVWAMAEKRAKDRVIIKLAGLYGAYSSDEATDFDDDDKKVYADEVTTQAPKVARKPLPQPEGDNVVPLKAKAAPEPETQVVDGVTVDADGVVQDEPAGDESLFDRLMRQVDEAQNVNAVTDLMLSEDTSTLKGEDEAAHTVLRDHAKARLAALGWPGSKKKGGAA